MAFLTPAPVTQAVAASSFRGDLPDRRPRPYRTSIRKRVRAVLQPPDSADTPPSTPTNGESVSQNPTSASTSTDTGTGAEASQPQAETQSNTARSTTAGNDTSLSMLQRAAENLVDAFYNALSSCSVLSRKWETRGDSFILQPKGTPKAIVHFIGGAFIGAAPHVMYRTFLDRLVARDYLIVTTPFDLSLDYLSLVAYLAQAWSSVRPTLPTGVPVIGVGHSAGALFHALGASLYPDAFDGAVANVLISYNNKQASDAIPLYGSVFAPAFAAVASAETQFPEEVRNIIAGFPAAMEDIMAGSILAPDRFRKNVLPTLRESRRLLDQLPPLVREIGAPIDEEKGPPEFYPPPHEVQASVESLYRVPSTLVVRFENDNIDESGLLEQMLQVRTKASGLNVTATSLPGSHVTPLAQDLPINDGAFGMSGVAVQMAVDAIGGRDVQRLIGVLDEWVESIINKPV